MTPEQPGRDRVRLSWKLMVPFGHRPGGRAGAIPTAVRSADRTAELELMISSLRVALAAERSARIADVARLEHLIARHFAACTGLAHKVDTNRV